MDYQSQQAARLLRQQQADARRHKMESEFHTKAQTIAAQLPGVWAIDLSNTHHVRFTRASDGLEIGVSLNAWKGRLTCTPTAPRNEGRYWSLKDWGVLKYEESTPERSASFDRPADKIAAEFVKHVVTPYESLYPQILERQRRDAEQHADSKQLARDLSAALGNKVQAFGNSELTLRSIKPDTARKIAAFLATLRTSKVKSS